MLVITLTSCPPALRGDLTKWLQELDTCVYVGKVSRRVREALWQRIKENIKNGRATMVYKANNEQGMDFEIYNADWEPIDFDGLKLMMRPFSARLRERAELKAGFSNAAKLQWAKRMQAIRSNRSNILDEYIVFDIETTGLTVSEDEILEISALHILKGLIMGEYYALVKPEAAQIPKDIEKLTGITMELLEDEGIELKDALNGFLEFAGDLPTVSHNANFDYGFIRKACGNFGLKLFSNRCVDTLALAHRLAPDVKDFKLTTLAGFFCIDTEGAHRSHKDCIMTKQLYEKLIGL